MKRKPSGSLIALLFCLAFPLAGRAQLTLDPVSTGAEPKRVWPAVVPYTIAPILPPLFANNRGDPPTAPILPELYSYEMLAPFCKLDAILEESVKIPVKFRLGDQQTVDRLERKGSGMGY